MIYSQTGFGRAEVSDEDSGYEIEIRSVNNRFLDLNFRLPRSLYSYENEFRQLINSRLDRGKVIVHVSERIDSRRNSKFGFDTETVKAFVDHMRSIGNTVGLKDNLGLSDLITVADWFSPEESDELLTHRKNLAIKGIKDALEEFAQMSAQEGHNLATDLKKRLDLVAELVENINAKAGENRQQLIAQLKERIENYLVQESLNEGRLEQEAAILVDKIDITEEIVRMRSHVKLFNEALENGGVIGKRLNFLLQEMNREINTMGSKAASPEISTWIVAIKEEQEKMREQVQNVV